MLHFVFTVAILFSIQSAFASNPECVETSGFLTRYLNGQWKKSEYSDNYYRHIRINDRVWDYALSRSSGLWKFSYNYFDGLWWSHIGSCKKEEILDCSGKWRWARPKVKFTDCSPSANAEADDDEDDDGFWFDIAGVEPPVNADCAASVIMNGLQSAIDGSIQKSALFEAKSCWNGKPLFEYLPEFNVTLSPEEQKWVANITDVIEEYKTRYLLQWSGLDWVIGQNQLFTVNNETQRYYNLRHRLARCSRESLKDCVANEWTVRFNYSAVNDGIDDDEVHPYAVDNKVFAAQYEDKSTQNGSHTILIVVSVIAGVFLIASWILLYRCFRTKESKTEKYQAMMIENKL